MTPQARVRHRGVPPMPRPSRPTRTTAPAYAGGPRRHHGDAEELLLREPAVGRCRCRSLLGLVRFVFLLLGRRFEEAFDLSAAWGWNVAHLPGTLARRRRAQKARRVKDRSLRRFMESAGLRLPRWFQTAERIWEEQREIDDDEDEPAARRLRHRTASFVGTHPVIVGCFLGVARGRGRRPQPSWARASSPAACCPPSPRTRPGSSPSSTPPIRTTPAGWLARGQPRAGGDGRAVGPAVRQHLPRPEGDPGGRARARRRDRCTGRRARLTGRPGPSVVAAAAYGASAIAAVELLPGPPRPPGGARRAARRARAAGGGVRRRRPAGQPLAVRGGRGGDLGRAGGLPAGRGARGARAGRGPARHGPRTPARADPHAGVRRRGGPPAPAVRAHADRRRRARRSRRTSGTTDVVRAGCAWRSGPGPGTWVVAALPAASPRSSRSRWWGRAYRAAALRCAVVAAAGLVLSWLSAAGYLPSAVSNPLAYGALAAVGRGAGHRLRPRVRPRPASAGSPSVCGRSARRCWPSSLFGGIAAAGRSPPWSAAGPSAAPSRCRRRGPSCRAAPGGITASCGWARNDGQPFPAPGGDPEGVVAAGDATLRLRAHGPRRRHGARHGPAAGRRRPRRARRRRSPRSCRARRRTAARCWRPSGSGSSWRADGELPPASAAPAGRRRSTSTWCRRAGSRSTTTPPRCRRPRCCTRRRHRPTRILAGTPRRHAVARRDARRRP